MSQFIEMNNNNNMDVFIEKFISFNDVSVQNERINSPFLSSETKFGLLSLKVKSVPITTKVQDFVFTVDCSGSMSDLCSDLRSKMEHIVHTLKNIIYYFHENSINTFITIYAFDDIIYNIIERTDITDENLEVLIHKVSKIRPRHSTDIEKALKNAKEYISTIKCSYPETNISHIFMTDGDVTSGSNNSTVLLSNIDETVNNAFIGFGVAHNDKLLIDISTGNKSSYHFVDKLENSGFVYGEILHGILYNILTNIELSINDGLIYDYNSNNWVNKIRIKDISSESNKIYALITIAPELCYAELNASLTNYKDDVGFNFVITDKQKLSPQNLEIQIFRIRVLQLLFDVNLYHKTKNVHSDWFTAQSKILPKTVDENKEHKKNYKKLLNDLFDEIKKYMTGNGLTDDKTLKSLCDDIYISLKTFDKRYGGMYTCGRLVSQGSQRCYTVSNTPNDVYEQNEDEPIVDCAQDTNMQKTMKMARGLLSLKPIRNRFNLNHHLSEFDDSPYLTPSARQVMRSVSDQDSSNKTTSQNPVLLDDFYLSDDETNSSQK